MMNIIKCLLLGHIWQRLPYAQYCNDGTTWYRCLRCGKVARR